MPKLVDRFITSSKWQAILVGVVVTLLGPKLQEWGLQEEQVRDIVILFGGGAGLQALTDFGKEKK